jgi:RNA polymerase sigma-70 factor, ECF subfamily
MSLEARITDALSRGAREEAATEAIRGFGPQILGYLTHVLGSTDDAGDAFSLFSEQLWRGLSGFRGESSVRVWAYRVAWSAAMHITGDRYRRRRERFRTSMASRLAAEVVSRTPFRSERDAAAMERLRAQLEPDERSLLVLRIDQRLSWKEVAEVIRGEGQEVDEAALRKRFERLKEKLGRIARASGLLE